jgi:hypothetical protein
LYTGNNSTQSIVNGIDLSTKGGLVWFKNRENTNNHFLIDTVRGVSNYIRSNQTSAEGNFSPLFSSFNTNGFSLNGTSSDLNSSSYNYASWTFREQPKFFDVVTYTGTGSNTTIAHSLGAVPGSIIVKRTDTTADWAVYHRSLANTQYLVLNTTAAAATGATWWNSTTPTSAVFSVGTDASVNASGGTYVAYIFAHDAGGFGTSGTDNVVSCGGFTCDGSGNATVSLGYEPQWILTKRTSSATDWQIYDNMRGFTADNVAQRVLYPNLTSVEGGGYNYATNSTGFSLTGVGASNTFIYIAIRRGPMAVPTLGTTVFSPVAYTGDGAANRAITTGFVSDMVWWKGRSSGTDWKDATLLIGTGRALTQNTTDAESAVAGYYINTYNNTGFTYGTSDASYNTNSATYVVEGFKRAPGFMDVVCYTGNGSTQTITHNLGVVPELIIGKCRTTAGLNWPVLFNFTSTTQDYAFLNLSSAGGIGVFYAGAGVFTAAPTSTSMFLDSSGSMNTNAAGQVAYLFATCAGVSKVGTYTGTGTTQTINCGFTAGSRFVMIKRVDSTGDWYVWDSARGIIAGNDPYLLLNDAAAEVTGTDYIDTAATGFEISSTAPAAINANGGTFIFLAIA